MKMRMITPPSEEPVTLAEAKGFLKIDGSAEDGFIGRLLKAARVFVELNTRRALITQSWELVLTSMPAEIAVPRPPLQSVEKIETVDLSGQKAVVDPALYEAEASGMGKGTVKLKPGCYWPIGLRYIITFKAGYGDSAGDVPDGLTTGILMVAGHLYENREGVQIPQGTLDFLAPYRVICI
jgi:uncharacterized phiE125 gp8 family phage protein